MTGAAVLANASCLGERHYHPRAGLEGFYVLADFLDHAGELMPQDDGHRHVETNPRPVALPYVPIGAADAAAFHAHHRSVSGAFGFGPILDRHRLAALVHYHNFHIP